MAPGRVAAILFFCLLAGARAGEGPSLTASPERIVLGRDKSVNVTLTAPGRAHPLMLSATAGKLGPLKQVGDGKWRAVLTPPPARSAQVSLITAWDSENPDFAPVFLAVPMAAQEALGFTVESNGRVTLTVADGKFGPFRADAQGRVEVPARLPPGVTEGVLSVHGQPDRRVPLPAQPFLRTAVVVAPSSIPADGKARAEVWIYAVDPSGAALAGVKPALRATQGKLSPMREVGGGVYQATFTAPVRLAAGAATLSVGLLDDPSGARAQASVQLSAGVRGELAVKLAAEELPADGEAQTIVTATLAVDGAAKLAGQDVTFTAVVGAVSPVVDKGDGTYVATYTAPAGNYVTDLVVARAPGGISAKTDLRLVPPPLLFVTVTPRTLVADGRSRASVRLVVRSEDGRLVPDGTVVELAARGGGIPREVKTLAGTATAFFTAGRKAGQGRIVAALGEHRVDAQLSLKPGMPARLVLAVARATMRSDGADSMQVIAEVFDEVGNPVPFAAPSLAASLGTLTAVREEGPGRFVSTYVAPDERYGGEAEIRAQGPGELSQRHAVRLVAPPPRMRVALGLLGAHNLGVLAAGGMWAEAALRLPWGEDLFYVSLDGGVAFGSRDVACAAPAECRGTADVRVMPARLGVYWRFQNGSKVAPYLGGGGGLYLARIDVTSELGTSGETSPLPGAYGRAGLDIALGPGSWFAEVRYDYARMPDGAVGAGEIGGLAAGMGYRLGL